MSIVTARRDGKEWTAREIHVLRALRKECSDLNQLCEKFTWRRRSAINTKMKMLGIGYIENRAWTTAEFETVHRLYLDQCSDVVISIRLDMDGYTRSPRAIQLKRAEMGLVPVSASMKNRPQNLTPEKVMPCSPCSSLFYRQASSIAHLIDLKRAGHVASQYELHIPDDMRAPIKFSGSAVSDQSYCGSPAAMCAV